MYVDAFWWWGRDVLLHLGCDLVVQNDSVQGPFFVSCDLLFHGCEEALRVEEAGHPENVGLALEQPGVELGVAVQEIREPKA